MRIKVLAANGLIKLKENTKQFVTQRDVAVNPKNLQIKEVEGVQVYQKVVSLSLLTTVNR
ncbi:MetQ/NlpA family ABC transporter substrate-binding protein [Nostoc sp.]|uniref:MetQ/NlpA family ABC transporter substrate-binding protein n=1 Tax=Nostoc sp. TaxID=1180 RepID=UPI002FF48802